MAKKEKTIKAYISRDEAEPDNIWVWHKPKKGNWKPQQLEDCEIVNYQREEIDMETSDCYTVKNFKKKFGFTIRKNTLKCIHLDKKLALNEDYKEFSNNPNRKK